MTDRICVDCFMDSHGVLETPDPEWPGIPENVTVRSWYVGETHFSWNPCDACGSPLGGDRFEATVTRN